MGAPNLFLLCVCGMFSGTIGSESKQWRGPSILESITSLTQKVFELEDSINTSIPLTIQVAIEELHLKISDKMAKNSKNCDSKVLKMGEALRKERQALLSNHSLRMEQLEERVAQTNQNVRNLTFLIEKLRQQMEDFQSFLICAGEPPSPRNGRPVDLERKHGSEVRYECERNFFLAGNSTVRCHFGKWEGQPPLCSLSTCIDEPPSPRNGRPVDLERKHGSEVRYECEKNFFLTRNSTVRCHFGKWEGQPPLCSLSTCADEPPSPRNGRPVNFERKHGSEVRYECEKNFLLTRNSTVRCHFGKWEGRPPFCSLPTCAGEPPSLRKGRPVDFERKHGSEVRYECERNFFLTGNSTVRCHFGKWEGQPPLCTRPVFLNPALTLRAYMEEYYVSNVTCSGEENPQKIEFYRLMDTGTGEALPLGAKTYSQGKAAVLDLSDVRYDNRQGVYQCGYQINGMRSGITFIIQRIGHFDRPQKANVFETVYIKFDLPNRSPFRWLHDGQRLPAGDGQETLRIGRVGREDVGIYERYDQRDRRGTQWFYRLEVRGCGDDYFGELCYLKCPPCYNGGICQALLGTCICPPGFKGSSCEVACGENRYGLSCSESCDGGDCKWQIFCRPEPFGCSCAPGYRDYYCNDKCKEGKFGADCKEICHCNEGSCDPYTGACPAGCSTGWTGQSCQIPA